MTENAIRLVTQPEPEREPGVSLQEASLEKLRTLVAEQVEYDNEVAANEEEQRDEDGFEIPTGKIPIDGHFSTSEVKELVDLAKQEGCLNESVDVKVLDKSDEIGDQIEIKEDEQTEEKDGSEKDEEKDENKENKAHEKTDEKTVEKDGDNDGDHN